MDFLTLFTLVFLPAWRGRWRSSGLFRLHLLLHTPLALALDLVSSEHILLLDHHHRLFALSKSHRGRLGLFLERFRQNDLIAFCSPLLDDCTDIPLSSVHTVQVDSDVTSVTFCPLLSNVQLFNVQSQQLASVQQLLGLLEAETVLAVSEAEDVLQLQEGAGAHIWEAEEGGGDVGVAGQVGKETSDQRTEQDQHVAREGDLLAASPCDHHLAGAAAHQLEGGLQYGHVLVITVGGGRHGAVTHFWCNCHNLTGLDLT